MKTFKQYCEADGCWSGYKKVGMKKKNGKNVPNCVPESKELEELNTNQLKSSLLIQYSKRNTWPVLLK